jgi:hypothetical protein
LIEGDDKPGVSGWVFFGVTELLLDSFVVGISKKNENGSFLIFALVESESLAEFSLLVLLTGILLGIVGLGIVCAINGLELFIGVLFGVLIGY